MKTVRRIKKGIETRYGIIYYRTVYRGKNKSFYVTLPTDWVRSVGLEDGDQVSILRVKDKLVICPNKPEKEILEIVRGDVRNS
jgi:virulence-associated protein VagC